ncbi:hypothetical protein NDY25_22465 (plasmid) [Xanthomonas hortorum pv. pelargonii]|nr:hypothetical protein [Xanthomonas hortorum]UUF04848.1 hypothetical protein NDY25_22465 [Xanthomonas hortorum pv. pelargonii]
MELADPTGCQRGRNLASLPRNVFGEYQQVYNSYKQSINQLRGSMAKLQNTRDMFAQRYPQVTNDATFQQLSAMVDQWQSQGRENVEDALYSGAAVLDTLDSTNQQFETMGQASQSATGALAATQAGNQINMLVGQEMMKLNAQTAAMNQAVLEEQARQMAGDRVTQRNIDNAHRNEKPSRNLPNQLQSQLESGGERPRPSRPRACCCQPRRLHSATCGKVL